MPVHEPIRKIVLKDGTVRYRLVVDVGHDGTGRRRQITRTYDRQKEARAELSRIRHQQAEGNYVAPSVIGARLPSRTTATRSSRSASDLGSGRCRASPRPTSSSLSTGC